MKPDLKPKRDQTTKKSRFNFTALYFLVFGIGISVFAWQSLIPRMPGMSASGGYPMKNNGSTSAGNDSGMAGMNMAAPGNTASDPTSAGSPSSMAGMNMGVSGEVTTVGLAQLKGDLHSLMVGRDGRLFYGQHHGVQISSDGGKTFAAALGGGDAMGMGMTADKLYLAGHGFFKVSSDAGQTWLQPGVGDLPGTDIHGFSAAPNGWLYANLAGRGLYRSTNDGLNWTAVTLETRNATTITATQGNPPVLYANTTNQGIFRSSDGGLKWQWLPGTQDSIPSALAVDPDNHTVMTATTGGMLLRSGDGGESWEILNAPDALALVALHPANPKWVYAVSKKGHVYSSLDGGSSWVQ